VPQTPILVTGAQGRVGGQLLPGLGDGTGLRLLDRSEGPAYGAAEQVVGELTDPKVLDRALDGVDAVVHLAGNPDPDADWRQLREPNVEGFVRLLATAQDKGVRRVVFASSVHAMGAYEGAGRWPIDPTWPPAPCCAYGATKAFDEAMARAYAYRTDLSVVGLRFGLCAEEATAEEETAGWLAPVDLRNIVRGALDADVHFGVYPAVSWSSSGRWDLRTAITDLGYTPVGYDPTQETAAADGDRVTVDDTAATGAPPNARLITCALDETTAT
jgi:nucleoside-diphosphate-sugar epimerase